MDEERECGRAVYSTGETASDAADGELNRLTGDPGTEYPKSHDGAPDTMDDTVGTRCSSCRLLRGGRSASNVSARYDGRLA